jgi:Ca2+-binding EF-hand superfamily protein
LFEVADKDKDGTVTFEEFKVWHNEHKAQQERARATKQAQQAGASEKAENAARRKVVQGKAAQDLASKNKAHSAQSELSQDERLEKLIKTFKALDRGGKGSVAPADFSAAVAEIDEMKQEDAIQAFT